MEKANEIPTGAKRLTTSSRQREREARAAFEQGQYETALASAWASLKENADHGPTAQLVLDCLVSAKLFGAAKALLPVLQAHVKSGFLTIGAAGEGQTPAQVRLQDVLSSLRKDPGRKQLLQEALSLMCEAQMWNEMPRFLGIAAKILPNDPSVEIFGQVLSTRANASHLPNLELILQILRTADAAKMDPVANLLEDTISLRTQLLETPEARLLWRELFILAKRASVLGCRGTVRAVCAKILQWEPEYWFARELPRQLDGYYSQSGQDRLIERFFIEHGARYHRFVEVGAFDGVHYSNVRRLAHTYGWSGISIEPVRKNFQNVVDAFAGMPVRPVRAAVSDHADVLEMNVSTYPHLPEWGTDVATLEDGETGRWDKYGAIWTKETVAVRTLNEILEEQGIEGFDFLSVDAEGHDLAVLKGLDWQQHRPSLVVVEYGNHRDEIFRYMLNQRYSLLHDNGQDLFLRSAEVTEEWSEERAHAAVNPHLVENGFMPKGSLPMKWVGPRSLLTAARFDIAAKLLWARQRRRTGEEGAAREIYLRHIGVFNGFSELDKAAPRDFEDAFLATYHSIREEGWRASEGCLPVDRDGVIVDGAHRTAAAVCADIQVPILKLDKLAQRYDYHWFLGRGLRSEDADAMAVEYARWKPNAVVVTLFPPALPHLDRIEPLLLRFGNIAYSRAMEVQGDGPRLLIWQMYNEEPWIGDAEQGWPGVANKARGCFPHGAGQVLAVLFEPHPEADLRKLKEEIRGVCGAANHSVHINDSHRETMLLSGMFFNENSRHFLNHARMVYLANFWTLFRLFRSGAASQQMDLETICLDGSTALSAYGLRDCRDIDFLHTGVDEWNFGNSALVGSHNYCMSDHVTARDDILFHPANHFWFHGVKIVSLGILRAMKLKRGEEKDHRDIALIDTAASGLPALHRVENPVTVPFHWKNRPPMVVGLVTMRNEASMIGQCLRALCRITDAIVVLDDASTDDSVEVVKKLQAECGVAHIVRKQIWHRDEPGDRNRLFNAGRSLGGTHFIVIDADECFTANLVENDRFRNRLLALEPGDVIELQWLQLWRSCKQYRNDRSIWSNNYKPFAFRDNWSCHYSSDFIHTPRIPHGLRGHVHRLEGPEVGVLHFQFVHWPNLLLKQAWYRCLERIRTPHKPAAEINKRYAPSKDESAMMLDTAPEEWFSAYGEFDTSIYQAPDSWRRDQISAWFSRYGREHFRDLDIWDIDWDEAQTGGTVDALSIPDITEGKDAQKQACHAILDRCFRYGRPGAYDRLWESLSRDAAAQRAFGLLLKILSLEFEAADEPREALLQVRQGIGDLATRLYAQPCRIVYLGASVTAQRNAYVKALHPLICSETNRAHEAVVAAKGATGVLTALKVLDTQVLSKRPDLCFLEYLTGDLNEGLTPWEDMAEALQALVHRLLKANCRVVFLNMFRGDYRMGPGNRALDAYESVAKAMGVPSIQAGRYLQDLILNGAYEYFELFRDPVHTTEKGATVAARFAASALWKLCRSPQTFDLRNVTPVRNRFSEISYVDGTASEISVPIQLWQGESYCVLNEGSPSLRWRVKGYLAGIQVVVGINSGTIEISAKDRRTREVLWDHWCDRSSLRQRLIPLGWDLQEETIVEVTFVAQNPVDCGFCYRFVANGSFEPRHAVHPMESLFRYECPCASRHVDLPGRREAVVGGLLVAAGKAL